jgi:hypothetical protein
MSRNSHVSTIENSSIHEHVHILLFQLKKCVEKCRRISVHKIDICNTSMSNKYQGPQLLNTSTNRNILTLCTLICLSVFLQYSLAGSYVYETDMDICKVLHISATVGESGAHQFHARPRIVLCTSFHHIPVM